MPPEPHTLFHRNRLVSALRQVGVVPRHDIFSELAEAYSERSRYYHDGCHVSECLKILDAYHRLAHRPHEIEIAIWFHDAVYDTTRGDNEEKSAEWAQRYLCQENAPADGISRIVEMIRATKTHLAESTDVALMLDIDLAILGAETAVFEAYDRAIRKEYGWVPEAQYRQARAAVLKGFLDRRTIFKTVELQRAYEVQARKNLLTKLHELDA